MSNQSFVLVAGKSATGKSLSLRNLKNPEGVIYLNCESGKPLPFPAKFKQMKVTHPNQVYRAFEEAEKHEEIHTIVIDSLTFLMDMYESLVVLQATNTMKAWGDYAQYFKRLMQQYVGKSSKSVIFLAHTMDVLNEAEMINETLVKVKGSLMNQGIEAWFTTVVAAKKMPVSKLEKYENDMLEITEDEEDIGVKYVFQTRLTKETVNERIRAPHGMWARNETYIDNDVQKLLDHQRAYYQQ